MAKDSEKELRPWDPRPWPTGGEKNADEIYAAVGRALSQWERYEGHLSVLFSAIVSNSDNLPARRAYNAVRTFEARIEMLRRASEAYFAEKPTEWLQLLMKTVVTDGKNYVARRNEIAHGVVDHFQPFPPTLPRELIQEFALYPSYANTPNRDLKDMPLYCYSKAELEYFELAFRIIATPPAQLAAQLIVRKFK